MNSHRQTRSMLLCLEHIVKWSESALLMGDNNEYRWFHLRAISTKNRQIHRAQKQWQKNKNRMIESGWKQCIGCQMKF